MGLTLVAHYYDRGEAVVASAALDAAGLPNWLENFNQVAVRPLSEIALGGYRLMVVEQDISAAIAVLTEATSRRSFEGERLSTDPKLAATILLWLATGFWLWLPLRRHKWHDVGR